MAHNCSHSRAAWSCGWHWAKPSRGRRATSLPLPFHLHCLLRETRPCSSLDSCPRPHVYFEARPRAALSSSTEKREGFTQASASIQQYHLALLYLRIASRTMSIFENSHAKRFPRKCVNAPSSAAATGPTCPRRRKQTHNPSQERTLVVRARSTSAFALLPSAHSPLKR